MPFENASILPEAKKPAKEMEGVDFDLMAQEQKRSDVGDLFEWVNREVDRYPGLSEKINQAVLSVIGGRKNLRGELLKTAAYASATYAIFELLRYAEVIPRDVTFQDAFNMQYIPIELKSDTGYCIAN